MSSRIKWISGLSLVFALLIATNLADRTSFRGMNDSVVTIYEDRLIAKGMVYDMRSILATKQVALADEDEPYRRSGYRVDDAAMRDLIAGFQQTDQTLREAREFESLQRRYDALEELEDEMAGLEGPLSAEAQTQLRTAHDAVIADLFALSRIQLTEGRRAKHSAAQALRAVDVMTQIEVALLIVLGIMIVALIFFWREPEQEA